MKVRNGAIAVLASTAIMAGGGSAVQASTDTAVHLPRFVKVSCPQEDSANCYWDASDRGNGTGHSFWAIPFGRGKVLIKYWDRDYGRRHDAVVPRSGLGI